jgi:hypothetical protein
MEPFSSTIVPYPRSVMPAFRSGENKAGHGIYSYLSAENELNDQIGVMRKAAACTSYVDHVAPSATRCRVSLFSSSSTRRIRQSASSTSDTTWRRQAGSCHCSGPVRLLIGHVARRMAPCRISLALALNCSRVAFRGGDAVKERLNFSEFQSRLNELLKGSTSKGRY